jgi:hypothetical protein
MSMQDHQPIRRRGRGSHLAHGHSRRRPPAARLRIPAWALRVITLFLSWRSVAPDGPWAERRGRRPQPPLHRAYMAAVLLVELLRRPHVPGRGDRPHRRASSRHRRPGRPRGIARMGAAAPHGAISSPEVPSFLESTSSTSQLTTKENPMNTRQRPRAQTSSAGTPAPMRTTP